MIIQFPGLKYNAGSIAYGPGEKEIATKRHKRHEKERKKEGRKEEGKKGNKREQTNFLVIATKRHEKAQRKRGEWGQFRQPAG